MVEQVDALRDRHDSLERRKRREAEGYSADVRLLKEKMRQVESQMGRAAIAKAKGKKHSSQQVRIKGGGDIPLPPKNKGPPPTLSSKALLSEKITKMAEKCMTNSFVAGKMNIDLFCTVSY
jgi:hypothetical protein